MKLGIDLDHVVVDLLGACADLGYYEAEDVLLWDDLFVLAGMTYEEFFEVVREKAVFENAQPVVGACVALTSLHKAGHEIVYITSRPHWAFGLTLDWVSQAGLDFASTHVLSNNESKSSVSCDLYLDDAPHVLTDLMDNHRRVVRYERPWNMESKDWDFSVANWEQFVTLVEDIKNRKAVAHPRSILPSAERVHPTMAHPSPVIPEVLEIPEPYPHACQGVKIVNLGGSPRDEELERLLAEEAEIEKRCGVEHAFPTMVEEIEPWCYDNGDRIPTDDMYDGERTEDWRRAVIWNDERRITDPATGGQKGQKNQQASLLPWDALMKVSEHYAAGAEKYSRDNWQKGYAWHLTFDALQRHLAAWWQGEDLDDEGLEHLNAACFHALALRTFTLRGIGTDDRPGR